MDNYFYVFGQKSVQLVDTKSFLHPCSCTLSTFNKTSFVWNTNL